MAFGRMLRLVRAEALGERSVDRVEGDQDAQILSLGHRRLFRFWVTGWCSRPAAGS
jgi:hypothetical protein